MGQELTCLHEGKRSQFAFLFVQNVSHLLKLLTWFPCVCNSLGSVRSAEDFGVCVWESVCVRKYVCMCEQVIEREKQGVKCHRPWTVWIRGGHFTSGPKQYSLIHNGQKNSNSSLSIFIFCFLLVFALWLSNSEERKKYRQLYFLFLKRSAFLKKDF